MYAPIANNHLIDLAGAYARAKGLRVTTVARQCAGQARLFDRLSDGATITSARATRIVQYFSDNWPAGLDWPAGIERPAPSRNPDVSPLSGAAPDDPLAAVRAAREEIVYLTGADDIDWNRVRRLEEEIMRIAMTLRKDGRIASPDALCLALGSARHVYDDVVRRYADGRPGSVPRDPRSETGRMLAALVASGDVRFAARRAA